MLFLAFSVLFLVGRDYAHVWVANSMTQHGNAAGTFVGQRSRWRHPVAKWRRTSGCRRSAPGTRHHRQTAEVFERRLDRVRRRSVGRRRRVVPWLPEGAARRRPRRRRQRQAVDASRVRRSATSLPGAALLRASAAHLSLPGVPAAAPINFRRRLRNFRRRGSSAPVVRRVGLETGTFLLSDVRPLRVCGGEF